MKYSHVILRILGLLIGALALPLGVFPLIEKGFPQGSLLMIVGSIFLAYGIGGNKGYSRFVRTMTLPFIITYLIWFGHSLWMAATDWEISNMSGEGSISLLTQPALFSVVVFGKLVMVGIGLVSLVLIARRGWLWVKAR